MTYNNTEKKEKFYIILVFFFNISLVLQNNYLRKIIIIKKGIFFNICLRREFGVGVYKNIRFDQKMCRQINETKKCIIKSIVTPVN